MHVFGQIREIQDHLRAIRSIKVLEAHKDRLDASSGHGGGGGGGGGAGGSGSGDSSDDGSLDLSDVLEESGSDAGGGSGAGMAAVSMVGRMEEERFLDQVEAALRATGLRASSDGEATDPDSEAAPPTSGDPATEARLLGIVRRMRAGAAQTQESLVRNLRASHEKERMALLQQLVTIRENHERQHVALQKRLEYEQTLAETQAEDVRFLEGQVEAMAASRERERRAVRTRVADIRFACCGVFFWGGGRGWVGGNEVGCSSGGGADGLQLLSWSRRMKLGEVGTGLSMQHETHE